MDAGSSARTRRGRPLQAPSCHLRPHRRCQTSRRCRRQALTLTLCWMSRRRRRRRQLTCRMRTGRLRAHRSSQRAPEQAGIPRRRHHHRRRQRTAKRDQPAGPRLAAQRQMRRTWVRVAAQPGSCQGLGPRCRRVRRCSSTWAAAGVSAAALQPLGPPSRPGRCLVAASAPGASNPLRLRFRWTLMMMRKLAAAAVFAHSAMRPCYSWLSQRLTLQMRVCRAFGEVFVSLIMQYSLKPVLS